MDEVLHAERVDRDRRKVTFRGAARRLPSGAFVRYAQDGGRARAYLVAGNRLLAWEPAGYTTLVSPAAIAEESGSSDAASIVAVLSAGYRPMLHPSAAACWAEVAHLGNELHDPFDAQAHAAARLRDCIVLVLAISLVAKFADHIPGLPAPASARS